MRIHVPPLRDRPQDIALLVNYFLKKFAQTQKRSPKSISQDAVAALEQFRWPGNVRELENVILRAIVMAKGDVILPSDLPPEVSTVAQPPVAPSSQAPQLSQTTPTTDAPSRYGPVSTVLAETALDWPALARAAFQLARQEPKLKILPVVERELIIQALLETQGNQVQAAKLLGITRATLRKRVEKFGIKQELAIK